MAMPYAIVRSKSLMGSLVNQKNATCLTLTDVRKEDSQQLSRMQSIFKNQFNDNTEALRQWGGDVMDLKTHTKLRLWEKLKLTPKNQKLKTSMA